MTVEPMRPTDAREALTIAAQWHTTLQMTPGAYGAVARTEDGAVAAFAMLRETPHGFVVDELWCAKTRHGRAGLGLLAQWLEATVGRIARDRGVPSLPLGGIARLDNPQHCAALAKRGYAHVANVYAKEIAALPDEGSVCASAPASTPAPAVA